MILKGIVLGIKCQSGVALIQVLLISAIISLLAIQFSYTARSKVEQTQLLEQRINTQLQVYSMQNIAMFSMLADDIAIHRDLPSFYPLIQNMPLDGRNISVTPNIVISVRDLASMLPLQYPSHPVWPYYLSSLGYSQQETSDIIHYLKDTQDSDRLSSLGGSEPLVTGNNISYLNRPIEQKALAKHVLAAYPRLLSEIDYNIHYYSQYTVNPMNMSASLLAGLVGDSAAEQLVLQRNMGTLAPSDVKNLMSIDFNSEDVSYFPSVYRRITVQIIDDLLWRESIDVTLSALSQAPVTVIGKQYN